MFKDEMHKRYGDLEVVGYTYLREPSNKCVIWKCKCVHCGKIDYHNGNNLRFSKHATCKNCGMPKRGR